MTDNAGGNKIEINKPPALPQTPSPIGSERIVNYYSDAPSIDEKRQKKREELEAGTLSFTIYTWGRIENISHLLVKRFMDYYFGFVWVRRK